MTSIVTLGAVAGAISTVISLWPSPDADDSAQVTVRIVPGIPLSEYQRRVESADVIMLKGYSPPDVDETSESTPGAEPSEEASSTQTADPDPTEAPASTQPDPNPTTDPSGGTADILTIDPTDDSGPTDDPGPTEAPPGTRSSAIVVDPIFDDAGTIDQVDQEFQNISGGDSLPSDFIAIGNSIGPNGEPVDPADAAEQIAEVLADARQLASATEPEPLGIVVSTDLELTGLRDEVLTLSWSMWQAAGGVRLSGDWLNDNLAYRIEPRTDHATTTLDVWIPLPREPGSYFVRVDLRSGATRVDSGESERFE